MPYHAFFYFKAMELVKEFELLEFCHVQKKKNDKADAFAKLVAALAAPLVAEHKSLYMTGSFFSRPERTSPGLQGCHHSGNGSLHGSIY